MSIYRRRKTAISELREEIEERILERLPTRDAARCALLSTQWRDAWYRQGRLVFDSAFYSSIRNRKDDCSSVVSIINNILMLRAGPVKKFTFYTSSSSEQPLKQSDLDRWCLFLSRNGVEELHLSAPYGLTKYKVPSCLLWCKTIKQLKVEFILFDFPANAACIFPGMTSSYFRLVEFRGNDKGLVFSMPKLKKLGLYFCAGIPNFVTSTPNLKSLSINNFTSSTGRTLLPLHLSCIKTLSLSLCSHAAVAVASTAFPTAINLEEIKLHGFNFGFGMHLPFAVQLLKKSPKLFVLEINIWKGSEAADSELLEDTIEDHLRTLEIVKLNGFRASEMELCLVKLLLSKSPALHHFVIRAAQSINDSLHFEATKKLLNFPRASPKSQIVYHSGAQILKKRI
ncbi:unnamed protein product [Cuscuta epithymum]|uniref:FBD domain-containing protein n=1 Tax=Cuscuta epithymum TaxID=186058 RepID=A0AAV0EK12_9ASTE|nr:unnamed protein product [Cuscuta epithymum]CAH9124115.1 unnamed protein product [Cuscuta epithymum]